MAKINNFQVKGIKIFEGRGGYGLNANLYYKGKKVAFVLDEGNGGQLDIRFNSREIEEEAEKEAREYYKRNPKYLLYPKMQIGDLVEELVELSDIEKVYKKQTKKGYNVTYVLRYHKRNASLSEICRSRGFQLISYNTDEIEEIAEELKKEEGVQYVEIFDSLDSFNIEK